jgi:2-succinyl-5-enolpyruvyl-6-hydroxy-3-cyclohexene-1-carboxylate synthase
VNPDDASAANTTTALLLRAFVDELARCGMIGACTSPGSRNAPLVVALGHERRIRCFSHIDERCAGFFALGLAKETGLPAAVTCTSGTAAAELAPAVIESREARVPLLVLSADRPPELRESGAGQTIDQLKLYGGAVKWFFEADFADGGAQRLPWVRALACRAYWQALEGPAGPVHLNFPLREPLVGDGPPPRDTSGREAGRPYVLRAPARLAAPGATTALEGLVARAQRGVVVAGRHEARGQEALGVPAAHFSAALRWPLLADPLSGARRGLAAVAHYDALLRDAGFGSLQKPDLVLRVGDLPTSKPLREWLAGLEGVAQVAIDPDGSWQDPDRVLTDSIPTEPAPALLALARQADALGAADQDWLGTWRSADERAAEAILGVLARAGLSEPTVAGELGVLLPETATLFVASSMPVRDVEAFWPVREDPPRVLCNRGANGIDGTVSAAYGAAAGQALHGTFAPVVLLTGDVALAHDIGGLLAARRLGLKLTIVLLDNGGGGIFDFLPVARAESAREIYNDHIATPPGIDFAHAAQLYGLEHRQADSLGGFREALEAAFAGERSGVVEVRSDRDANRELHERAWRAVASALERP